MLPRLPDLFGIPIATWAIAVCASGCQRTSGDERVVKFDAAEAPADAVIEAVLSDTNPAVLDAGDARDDALTRSSVISLEIPVLLAGPGPSSIPSAYPLAPVLFAHHTTATHITLLRSTTHSAKIGDHFIEKLTTGEVIDISFDDIAGSECDFSVKQISPLILRGTLVFYSFLPKKTNRFPVVSRTAGGAVAVGLRWR